MKEIRIVWSVEDRVNELGEQIMGSLWTPATPQTRHDFQIIVEVGNETYGPGTHWLEEREA